MYVAVCFGNNVVWVRWFVVHAPHLGRMADHVTEMHISRSLQFVSGPIGKICVKAVH